MKNKKSLIIISTLILTAITFIVCFSAISKSAYSSGESLYTIVLDAGHGGVDGGVSGKITGVKESDLNLKVVKKLENLLIAGGFNVVLTRSTDAGLYGIATSSRKKKDMAKRREIIENAKPTLVISIHMNNFPVSSRRGAQVFFKKSSEEGKRLATSLQKTLNALDDSVKDYSALSGDYYILNCTEYPSAIVECGFLSNREDEALLITDEYQEKLAYGIFQGIIDYLSVSSFKFCD